MRIHLIIVGMDTIMEMRFEKLRFWKSSFDIVVDDRPLLTASRRLPALRDDITLRDREGHSAARIRQNWYWIRPCYSISLSGGAHYCFETLSFWHQVFSCSSAREILQITGHTKRRYSLFRGRRQIGAVWRDAVTFLGQYNFYMVAEDDENAALLAAILIILQSLKVHGSGDVNTLEIDLGLAFESRAFDAGWLEEHRKHRS